MKRPERKIIENILFEVYEKGLQQSNCNLTDCYEKIMQALNIPCVINLHCEHCAGTGKILIGDNTPQEEVNCIYCEQCCL